MYYKLQKISPGNKHKINDLFVTRETFNKIFLDADKFKQIEYTCYFNNDNDFIKEWILKEEYNNVKEY